MTAGRLSTAFYSLLIIFLTSPVFAAAPRCLDLFTFKPKISAIRPPNVFKVETGTGAYAYKIFRGGDIRYAFLEHQALLLLADVAAQIPQSRIQATSNPRVTRRNEWLLKDELWGYLLSSMRWQTGAPLKQPEMVMLVTRFESGRETLDFFNDPNITVAAKQQAMDSFWNSMKYAIDWINSHPEFRFNGQPVTVKDRVIGDVYEFPSKDGIFEYEYRTVEITNGPVSVLLDSISNTILKDNGDFVLFDPE